MKTKTRLGAIASALLLLGAITAFADGTTLRIGQVGDIRSLEPYRNATPNYLFIENLYDQLLFNPRNGGFEGEAAVSWEISSDFTTATVTLREGMVSHDGTPADAHMLKWDIEERRKGWGRSDMPVFGGVDATVNVIDDLTAEITLSKPFANMETKLSLFMLTDPDMYMRDDGAVAEFNQEDKVIGSGPFKLVEYEPGSHMHWEKFADHWDADSVALERVEITYFGDAAAMVAALEAGEIDLAYRPPYADAVRFLDDSDYTVWIPETVGLASILMVNPNAPGLEDKRVRQAISWAINREAVSGAIFEGLGMPTASPAVPASFAYTPELDAIPPQGDADKARELLAAAGNPEVSVKFTYPSNDTSAELIAQVVQANLKDVGITLELDPQERNIYIQMRTSQTFQMMASVMAGSNGHPADLTDSFVFHPVNHGFFNDPEETVIPEYQSYVDNFNKGMAATTDAESVEAWSNALLAINDGAWVLFLSSQPYISVSTSALKGLTWTQHDKPVFKYVHFE
ncbi:MAG: ABC transporter substrate-binding protein [Spirochaetaceae bacterium]|nr:ABC transporter substrate-binding protein [Spirochaetaceae bacterium]